MRSSTSQLADADDGGIRSFRVDVTDREAIERASAEISEGWGVPHVLVNGAALDSPPDAPAEEVGPFEHYPIAAFDQVMDVNVKGTLLACQVIGARMAEEGRGSIVNISSVYGMLSPSRSSTTSGGTRERSSSSRLRIRFRSRRCTT